MCVLFTKESGHDRWSEFGRTETIMNNLNPEWTKRFQINYFFEERQHLKFEIYDIDCPSPDLRKHDFLGRMECTLGEIVAQGKFERPLIGSPTNTGKILVICAEEMSTSKEELIMRFEGKKLDKKDWFGKSDPYLSFYRQNPDGSLTVVHRTEYIKNTLNPKWNEFRIESRVLCAGDYNRPFIIRCYDWNASGKEDLIGEFTTNVNDMLKVKQTRQPNVYQLINPEKKRKSKSYVNSGQIVLTSLQSRLLHSFVDYVNEGTQLNCTIAIDFTASNGDPRKAESLHHINPQVLNQYQRALTAVGEIIQDYDSDKLFPLLGFGARLPPDGRVSHEFFVNGDAENPYCNGLAGVVQAYQNCLVNVQLYGPTYFAPCINHVARFAAAKRDGSEYFILLIITDGVINDMELTKRAIVSASCLPLSIIIVGVGNADFEAMNELDADVNPLTADGRVAERDIVQFVPFNRIANDTSLTQELQKARLAKEVLAEIPTQFLSYMRKNNILPGSWSS